jgi:hypothetical protein
MCKGIFIRAFGQGPERIRRRPVKRFNFYEGEGLTIVFAPNIIVIPDLIREPGFSVLWVPDQVRDDNNVWGK